MMMMMMMMMMETLLINRIRVLVYYRSIGREGVGRGGGGRFTCVDDDDDDVPVPSMPWYCDVLLALVFRFFNRQLVLNVHVMVAL